MTREWTSFHCVGVVEMSAELLRRFADGYGDPQVFQDTRGDALCVVMYKDTKNPVGRPPKKPREDRVAEPSQG
ncbi:MAG: hypothetical protein B7733_06115 [Myxococcales bacterium FL481]|nr:MAG: hypothetical protein B7733_06115 [Myxococcales bacterium FL481]